jgi:hypothetical protein
MSEPGPSAAAHIGNLIEGLAIAVDDARRHLGTGGDVDLVPLQDDVHMLTELIVASGIEAGTREADNIVRSLAAIAEGLDRLEADLTREIDTKTGQNPNSKQRGKP